MIYRIVVVIHKGARAFLSLAMEILSLYTNSFNSLKILTNITNIIFWVNRIAKADNLKQYYIFSTMYHISNKIFHICQPSWFPFNDFGIPNTSSRVSYSPEQPTANQNIIQSFEESGLNKTDGIRHSLIEVPKPEQSLCLLSHLDLFKNKKIHPRVT